MGKTKQNKKILIYSPYWKILGGGEKYLLDIAAVLSKNNQVFLVANEEIKRKSVETFGIKLDNIELIKPENFRSRKFYDRFFYLRKFDLCFHMTDGSLFIPGARRNYLIIQSPLHIPKLSLSTRFKISGWKIICYSSFMQKIIEEKFHKHSLVIPPAVDLDDFKNIKVVKEKIFLTVGRFFTSFLHEKRHDFLIDFFKKNYLKYFRGWKLYVCGNLTEASGDKTLINLKAKIKKFPVFLKVNINHRELIKIYKKSSIYWHAAGFNADSKKNPEKLEHFGITTVEAMAAKNTPVVYSGGGQKDIVDDGKNGYLWDSEQKFLDLNLKLINNPKLLLEISKNAQKKSGSFSRKVFAKQIYDLV